MKRKIKQKKKISVYFTNYPKILKRLEIFSKEHKIAMSTTILGFCALGIMIIMDDWGR